MIVPAIVRRDMIRFIRSPGRTALLLAVPLVLAAMLTLVFGGGGPQGMVLRVLILNQDEGLLGRLLAAAGNRAPEEGEVRLELVEVNEEGYAMLDRGEGSALVRIPPTFTADFLAGRPVALEVVKNPAERILPVVVEEGVSLLASVLSQGSHVLRDELDRVNAMFHEDRAPSLAEVTALSELIYHRMAGADRYLFPPVITLETAAREDEAAAAPQGGASALAFFLPGLIVLGVFFFAQAVTTDMVREREAGLLRHLLTAPVTVRSYLTGKCLSTILACLAAFAVLLSVGAAAGVSWGAPVALAAMVTAISAAAAGTMLLLAGLARTERQADAFGTILIIAWAMLGGVFLPISQIPAAVRPLSAATLTYWSVDGLSRLVAGQGVSQLLPNLAILTGAGAALLLVGAAVLRRRIAGGGL